MLRSSTSDMWKLLLGIGLVLPREQYGRCEPGPNTSPSGQVLTSVDDKLLSWLSLYAMPRRKSWEPERRGVSSEW
jgi:hypothetical protein